MKTDSKGASGSDVAPEKNGVTDKELDSATSREKKKDSLATTTEGGEPSSSAADNSTGEASSAAPTNTSNGKESKEEEGKDGGDGVPQQQQQQQPIRENTNNKGRMGNRGGDRRMDRSGRRPPSPHRQRHTVLTFQHIRVYSYHLNLP